jgi:hypothetical protein
VIHCTAVEHTRMSGLALHNYLGGRIGPLNGLLRVPSLAQEKAFATTPNSALSPHVTGKTALVRYTSTPVYATSNSKQKVKVQGMHCDAWVAAGLRPSRHVKRAGLE